jgi:hypothetical protein
MEEAKAEGRSRAQRYVLLNKAAELAIAAGEVESSMGAVDEMHKWFEIDVDAVKAKTRGLLADALKRLAEQADTPATSRDVARNGLLLIGQAKESGAVDMAKDLAPVILGAARKSGDSGLINQATLIVVGMRSDG